MNYQKHIPTFARWFGRKQLECVPPIYMLEPKAKDQTTATDVLAKRDVATTWCQNASAHAKTYGGKPWTYVLLPHDAIADNMTIEALAQQFAS